MDKKARAKATLIDDPNSGLKDVRLTLAEWLEFQGACQRVLDRGGRQIRVPSALIFVAGIMGLIALVDSFPQPKGQPRVTLETWLDGGSFLVGCFSAMTALGWLWWSYMSPRWQIWALANVPKPYWPWFEHDAILMGFIPNERTSWGRFYARTQFWTKRLRDRQTELLRSHGLSPRRKP